jgi:hypothetical protein
MKFVNARAALVFALFLGVAAAVTVIAYAGSRTLEVQAAAPQPASTFIPF